MFEQGGEELGYHPFPQPIATPAAPYTNSEGVTLGACQYCGFCERIGCEANAKARPACLRAAAAARDPKFTLRARAWVSRLDLRQGGKRKVTGVVYTDTRNGEEYEQPAGIVVLSAYVFGNVSLLLHSGIGEPYDPATGKGAVGKNYCYQLSRMGVTMFFENKEFNPFMGAPGSVMALDDVDGDNFDHSGLGFLGGSRIACGHGDGRPISYRAGSARHPALGLGLEEGDREMVSAARSTSRCHGSNYANRNNYLDLDPTYKDQLGRPLLRMTYNFVENDYKVAEYTLGVAAKIARAMNPTHHRSSPRPPRRLRHRALPIDAQYRRHDHGHRPEDQRGQPLSASLGRQQSLHHGRLHLPAAAGLQPDRTGGRARLLVGRGHHHEISQEPRPAGAGVTQA